MDKDAIGRAEASCHVSWERAQHQEQSKIICYNSWVKSANMRFLLKECSEKGKNLPLISKHSVGTAVLYAVLLLDINNLARTSTSDKIIVHSPNAKHFPGTEMNDCYCFVLFCFVLF